MCQDRVIALVAMSDDTVFPLIGEPLALDLVNTRPHTLDGRVDLIATRAGLQSWIDTQAERLSSPPTRVSDVEVRRVMMLRDHIATAIDHARRGERPPPSSLKALTGAEKAAPTWQLLSWDGRAVTATPQRNGDAVDRLLANLAYAASDLLTDPRVTSIRRCAGPDCTLLFLPDNPRRQWCSPTLCGNRVRVARYYERHSKTGTTVTQP
jgi:predicted RNA-binding Zn ribbon-like protein